MADIALPAIVRMLSTWSAFAVPLLAGCGQHEYSVPPADGPLALELRHPTTAPVAVTDSISLWGTVGGGRARLRVNGQSVHIEPNGGFAAFLPLPAGDTPVLELEASKGGDTLRRTLHITRIRADVRPPAVLRPARGWVRLRRIPSDTTDSATQARPVFARWTPGGALALQLPLGVRLPVEVETDNEVRVRLSRGIVVWVSRAESEPIPAPRTARSMVGGIRLSRSGARTVVTLAAPGPLATRAETVGRHVRWTLFGARAGSAQSLQNTGGLVRQVSLRDMGDGRVIVDLELTEALLGWRTAWCSGLATLELRSVDGSGPGLEGLVVALDPGHPPEGTTGPTGLSEDSVNLAIALETAHRLRALGAKPILTRSRPGPVSLEARVALAEAANAELFVSIHANAPGDGRPPESVDGTRVYWWHPHALALAKALRDSVPAATGQLRIGTVQSNLSVLRPTWFPAVLVEVTALVLPVREAWLRSPEGIAASAAGIVAGIRAWQSERLAGEAPTGGGTGS